jgi:ABC-type transporter Mla maintaining outer membrane lipid asymmetry ATPase subunit MlaF
MSDPSPPAGAVPKENPKENSPAVLELIEATIPSIRDSSRVVLEGVNWRVAPGEFWAIAGLARSGKTDFLMVATGVMRPTSGTYRLFGHDLTSGFKPEQLMHRLKVGMVFDGGQLLHHLTLAENVALPLEYHATANDTAATIEMTRRLQSLVDLTGLREYAMARPAEVNRNWQQRYGLARALALKPEILFLDNPLSGLDPRDSAWWLEMLKSLAAGHPAVDGRPLTLIVTGDDLRPWQNRANRFAVISDRAFIDVGGRAGLEAHPEPLLRELLPSAVGLA